MTVFALFQKYLPYILFYLLAIFISIPFRYIIFRFLFHNTDTNPRGQKYWVGFLKDKNFNTRRIIPYLSWIGSEIKVKIINIIFDIFYPAIAFVLINFNFNYYIIILKIILIAVLISLAVIDWHTLRLPNIFIFSAAVIITLIIVFNNKNFTEAVYGCLIGAGLGLSISAIGKLRYKENVFGMGDVKLMTMIGYLSGWKYFIPLFLAGAVLATVYSLAGIFIGKMNWKSKVPLGTFLNAAVIVYLVFEESLFKIILFLK
jgi:prepilin signal peptidase PulO-like enzyme (type II secretory pathway)